MNVYCFDEMTLSVCCYIQHPSWGERGMWGVGTKTHPPSRLLPLAEGGRGRSFPKSTPCWYKGSRLIGCPRNALIFHYGGDDLSGTQPRSRPCKINTCQETKDERRKSLVAVSTSKATPPFLSSPVAIVILIIIKIF